MAILMIFKTQADLKNTPKIKTVKKGFQKGREGKLCILVV